MCSILWFLIKIEPTPIKVKYDDTTVEEMIFTDWIINKWVSRVDFYASHEQEVCGRHLGGLDWHRKNLWQTGNTFMVCDVYTKGR